LGPGHDYVGPWIYIYGSRRLFKTSRGYLGIGHDSLLVGDYVAILPGSNVPFALRKVDGNQYRLVGETYVHGIMHGEALEMNRWNLELIKLV